MTKTKIIKVQGIDISIYTQNEDDYICLTDMVKGKNDDSRPADVIKNWIRTRTTIEFLGTWELLFNPHFKVVEFDHFKKEAGLPTFTMSVTNWIDKTNAKGIFVKLGRYGGVYAHKDIAFEFGAAISPLFKLYIIKEYQRLKEIETNEYNLEWNVKRVLSKANYTIHTDAIDKYIIPHIGFTQKREWIYASEADMLNIIMFGCTAKQWREVNMDRAMRGENVRDMASIDDLAILSILENLNALLIKKELSQKDRGKILNEVCKEQREALKGKDILKSIKKLSDKTYIEHEKQSDDFDKGMDAVLGYTIDED